MEDVNKFLVNGVNSLFLDREHGALDVQLDTNGVSKCVGENAKIGEYNGDFNTE
jgi:hypothetical protein